MQLHAIDHRPRLRLAIGGAIAALALAATPAAAQAATSLYPDLKTLTPKDLRFETVTYQGTTRQVLRFSNTVWNAGQGTLELQGTPGGNTGVTQRVFDDSGGSSETTVSTDFIYHPGHNHFHFEDFAEYELWTKASFNGWIASGRTSGQPSRVAEKVSFCVMDTTRIQSLLGSPASPFYSGCGSTIQGLSIGWGDTYGYHLAEQWIDLGGGFLPDGDYVLRSVADPRDKLYESPSHADASRESPQANEAITAFNVRRGRIRTSKR